MVNHESTGPRASTELLIVKFLIKSALGLGFVVVGCLALVGWIHVDPKWIAFAAFVALGYTLVNDAFDDARQTSDRR